MGKEIYVILFKNVHVHSPVFQRFYVPSYVAPITYLTCKSISSVKYHIPDHDNYAFSDYSPYYIKQ